MEPGSEQRRRAYDKSYVARFMAAHGAWVALIALVLTTFSAGMALAARWTFLEAGPGQLEALSGEISDLTDRLDAGGAVMPRLDTLEAQVASLQRAIMTGQQRDLEQDRVLGELLEFQTETICLLRAQENGGFPTNECIRQTTLQRLEQLREQIRGATIIP